MKLKKVLPIGEFFLGKLIKDESNKNGGGIVLPGEIKLDTYDLVEVIECGYGLLVQNTGEWNNPGIVEGNRVLVFKDRYDKIKVNDEEMILFRITDVSAIVE